MKGYAARLRKDAADNVDAAWLAQEQAYTQLRNAKEAFDIANRKLNEADRIAFQAEQELKRAKAAEQRIHAAKVS